MKESTYQDLNDNQKVALMDAVNNKHRNLVGKYEQLDKLVKYYEDEISKIECEIKEFEADLQNTAVGIIPINVSNVKGRLGINTTQKAINLMKKNRRTREQL